jgi:hypothetical protein
MPNRPLKTISVWFRDQLGGYVLSLILAPVAQRLIPLVATVSVAEVVGGLLWLIGLSGLVVASVRNAHMKKAYVELLNSRCSELIRSADEIAKTYPHVSGGPIKSRTYLPDVDKPVEAGKAALHRFNGRIDDFVDCISRGNVFMKLKVPVVNVNQKLTDIGTDLEDVHAYLRNWLF